MISLILLIHLNENKYWLNVFIIYFDLLTLKILLIHERSVEVIGFTLRRVRVFFFIKELINIIINKNVLFVRYVGNIFFRRGLT